MESGQLDELSAELAQDLAQFGRVDFSHESQNMDAAIEEMLAKLEEFGSLMEMMSDSCGVALSERVPRLMAARQSLQQLFRRADALETFVAHAGQQLTALEQQMEAAERQLAPPTAVSQALAQFLPSRRQEAAATSTPDSFVPADVYRTEDFFHPPVVSE